jgi:hypothetical protein
MIAQILAMLHAGESHDGSLPWEGKYATPLPAKSRCPPTVFRLSAPLAPRSKREARRERPAEVAKSVPMVAWPWAMAAVQGGEPPTLLSATE